MDNQRDLVIFTLGPGDVLPLWLLEDRWRAMKRAVIVTGLPASGKTTIARGLALGLGYDFLDKDDFLEDLYDRLGVHSWGDRQRLSRQSDRAFQEAAIKIDGAVLASHWRPLGSTDESGTPTEWLAEEFEALVEVHCKCPPEDAHARFLARTRHPGHLDNQRDAVELANRFTAWAGRFPIGIGTLVEMRTDGTANDGDVIDRVREALENPRYATLV